MSGLIVYTAGRRADYLSRQVLKRCGATRRWRVEWTHAESWDRAAPDLTEVAGILVVGGYAEALQIAALAEEDNRVPWACLLCPPSVRVLTEELAALRSADWVASPWLYGRREVREATPSLRVRALPVGIDTRIFRPLTTRRSLRAEEGLSDAFVVGCVAQNEGRNRLPALLKAFAALRSDVPDAVLRLLTDATTYWPKHSTHQRTGWELEELSARYGIAEAVEVGKRTPWYGATATDLNRFYNTLDALVVCGVGDGLGIEMLEAMSAGVPVIAPDYGVPAEIVTGRGLVTQVAAKWLSSPDSEELILPDVDHLAEQLRTLHGDAKLRENCARKGRRFAERHDLAEVAPKWRETIMPWLHEAREKRRRLLRAEIRKPKAVLVRRDRGIGDVLFALTAAYWFKQSQPRVRIEFTTQERHATWVEWFDFVEAVHTQLPDTPYDRTLDYEAELDYAHQGDRCEWMGRRAGVEVPEFMPAPAVPPKLVAKAKRLVAGPKHERLFVLAPYGSGGSLVRSLTQEQIRAVVAEVRPGDGLVLVCEERIEGVAAPNLINLSGKLSVEEAIAVVSLCDGLIGVDSGFVHWAGVFRKPVVALFTHIGAMHRVGPHQNLVAIQPSLPCAPCGDVWPRGPYGHQPPCRPDYRWTPQEPRVECVTVHEAELAVGNLYELVDEGPRRTVVNLDCEGNTTQWRLRPPLREAQAPALTSVVILNLNTWDRCTRRCVESALANTTPPFEIVLLDNGSNAQEARLVKVEMAALRAMHPQARLTLTRSGKNLGFPGGVNRALKHVSEDARYVCLLNSDCYLEEPEWNVRAAELFAQDWRLAALSLTQGEHRYFLDGDSGKDYFFPELDATLGDCEVINGACLLVDRKKTGPFKLDERFSPASREDDDLSFWIREQGWAIGQCPDFRVHHEHSTTLERKSFKLRWQGKTLDYPRLLERNRKLLLHKWSHMLHPKLGAAESLKRLSEFYRPRVSVVLPTHKRLDINDLAIRSVLDQRMKDLELLLVTVTKKEQRELSRRYRDDSRVRVLQQERRGIANARNTGLDAAQGKYLAHMDDDEFWQPDHLNHMVEFLDHHEDVALAYADVHRVRGTFVPASAEGRRPRFRQTKDEGYPWCQEFDLESFRRANCIPASAAVLRREVLETAGYFDESFRYADDWEYWLRVATTHRVAHNCTLTHLGKATVEYRAHGHDQATARDPETWASELALIRERYGAD